jgi:hypothetical protein
MGLIEAQSEQKKPAADKRGKTQIRIEREKCEQPYVFPEIHFF